MKLKFIYFHSKKFSTSLKSNNYLTKYSSDIVKLFEAKIILNSLLEEKIYHYSILNFEPKELLNLQKVTKNHQHLLNDLIRKYKLNKSDKSFFIDEKIRLLNTSSILLKYSIFIDLIKYFHENLEENLNNLIRDMLVNGEINEDTKTNLLKIRDEWRECFQPEVLDKNSVPIYTMSYFDRINLEINKQLINNLN